MATDLALTGAQARELERHGDAVRKLQDDHQTHAVKTALKVGEHLTAIRSMFPNSSAFVEHVLKEFGYSKSTAYNYIAAFEVFGRAKHVEHFEDSAMYLLAKDSTPEAAYEQAMKLASGGTKITKTKAQEIIDKVLAKSKAMQKSDDSCPTELENDTQQGGDVECPDCAGMEAGVNGIPDDFHCCHCDGTGRVAAEAHKTRRNHRGHRPKRR